MTPSSLRVNAANARMAALAADVTPTADLPRSLTHIVRRGWVETTEGVLLVSWLMAGCATVSPTDSPDATGYECFVNSLQIDDHVSGSASEQLAVALSYAEAMIRVSPHPVNAIINMHVDDSTCVVRFHRPRTGEDWLVDDLELYETEAVMTLAPGHD